MIGEQRRRVDVEKRVREELERLGLYRLPVNPVIVANKLGMKVKGVVFKDSSHASIVSVKDGTGTIFVSDLADEPYRMRVAVAHALGHYFLHLMEKGVVKDGQILDRPIDMFWEKEPDEGQASEDWMMEIEANRFADELLMPVSFVREEWASNPNIPRLARMFGVTDEAIGRRVANLNLWIPGKKDGYGKL